MFWVSLRKVLYMSSSRALPGKLLFIATFTTKLICKLLNIRITKYIKTYCNYSAIKCKQLYYEIMIKTKDNENQITTPMALLHNDVKMVNAQRT